MKKVLVIAAHPDDELLGVGGTVIRHVQEGDEVYSVIACEGESMRYHQDVGQTEAIQKAASIMGVKKVYHLRFPDQKLDQYSLVDLITPIETIAEHIRPNIIYCQNYSDINRDHKILFEAANVAFRPLHFWIEGFYTFYTVSSTEWGFPSSFSPDTWVEITDQLETKIKAFEAYQSEVREYPHPRSVKALRYAAYFWGNQCSMEAAEAFVTVRRMNRR